MLRINNNSDFYTLPRIKLIDKKSIPKKGEKKQYSYCDIKWVQDGKLKIYIKRRAAAITSAQDLSDQQREDLEDLSDQQREDLAYNLVQELTQLEQQLFQYSQIPLDEASVDRQVELKRLKDELTIVKGCVSALLANLLLTKQGLNSIKSRIHQIINRPNQVEKIELAELYQESFMLLLHDPLTFLMPPPTTIDSQAWWSSLDPQKLKSNFERRLVDRVRSPNLLGDSAMRTNLGILNKASESAVKLALERAGWVENNLSVREQHGRDKDRTKRANLLVKVILHSCLKQTVKAGEFETQHPQPAHYQALLSRYQESVHRLDSIELDVESINAYLNIGANERAYQSTECSIILEICLEEANGAEEFNKRNPQPAHYQNLISRFTEKVDRIRSSQLNVKSVEANLNIMGIAVRNLIKLTEISTDKPRKNKEETGCSIIDSIPAPNTVERPDKIYPSDIKDIKQTAVVLLNNLPVEDELLLVMQYGLGITQKEIAKEIIGDEREQPKISVRVRNILTKIFKDLCKIEPEQSRSTGSIAKGIAALKEMCAARYPTLLSEMLDRTIIESTSDCGSLSDLFVERIESRWQFRFNPEGIGLQKVYWFVSQHSPNYLDREST